MKKLALPARRLRKDKGILEVGTFSVAAGCRSVLLQEDESLAQQ